MDAAPILIRADADTQIGIGHVMRCVAFAQAWQDAGGRATFVLVSGIGALEARLFAEGLPVRALAARSGTIDDARETSNAAHRLGASWVIVDGYHFRPAYLQALVDAGSRVVLIDDNGHLEGYPVDIVVNQNLHATESLYSRRGPATRLLLGPQFALLRREFSSWRGARRTVLKQARKLLIMSGGSDPSNITFTALRAAWRSCQAATEGGDTRGPLIKEIVVVVGPCSRYLPALDVEVRNAPIPTRVETNVVDMTHVMQWADVAVSAAGSTCWELAFMGLPAVAIVVADNQRLIARNLAEMGVLLDLGWHSAVTEIAISTAVESLMGSYENRAAMSMRGQSLVDGLGAERIVAALRRSDGKLAPAAPSC